MLRAHQAAEAPGAVGASRPDGSGTGDPPKSAVRQGKVARRFGPFCTPTAAEPSNRFQTLHLSTGLVSLGLQAPRLRLQTSPATYQHPLPLSLQQCPHGLSRKVGWGPEGLSTERMGGTRAQESNALRAWTDQNPHSCSYQGGASPVPRLDTQSLPRPSKPALAGSTGFQFTTSPHPTTTAGQRTPLPLPFRPVAGGGGGRGGEEPSRE